MKRMFFAGLAFAVLSSGMAFGQQNYTDDVYFNGSKANHAAKQEIKTAAKAEQQENAGTAYYNSSGDNYQSDQANNQVYNQNAYDDEGNNYSDDGYATRIQRFYHPVSGIGYWGNLYAPFWNAPFYGWTNSWWMPGFSFNFGYNPFWSFGWGWNSGFGYNSFYNPFYSPYYGYGGYGYGFMNGYYAGLYDGWGGYYGYGYGWNNNHYQNNNTYGPRGMRRAIARQMPGGISGNGRTTTTRGLAGTIGQVSRIHDNGNNGHKPARTTQALRLKNNNRVVTNDNQIHLGNTHVYNNNLRRGNASMTPTMNRAASHYSPNTSRNNNNHSVRIFSNNRSSNNNRRSEPRHTQRIFQSATPTRSESHYRTRSYSPPERSFTPQRSYTPHTSAPSRSSAPSSSRSSGRSFRR